MMRVPDWCAAAGLFVGTVALAEFVAPAVLEKFSLGPFKDKAPFGSLDPLSQPHPLSAPLTSASGRLTISRFDFVPPETMQTDGDGNVLQWVPGRVAPRIQDSVAAKPMPALVRQPFLVPHALANVPATTAPGKIRALQRELKRLGCYTGKIDGAWGPVSREAAIMFVQSAGLALPADKPYQAILRRSQQRFAPACTDTATQTKERAPHPTPTGQTPSATSPKGTGIVALDASSGGGAARQNSFLSHGVRDVTVQVSSWRKRPVSGQ
jgi:hypothetical protein